MPLWLIDPSATLYFFLGAAVIVFGVLWLRSQSRSSLIRFGIAALIAAGVVILDVMNESPREEAVRRMKAIADASVTRNYDALFSHVSDAFQYKKIVDKSGMLAVARRAESYPDWRGADVWDFDRNEVEYVDANTVRIGFMIQAKGLPQAMYWCVATFRKDAQGYRLAEFLFYNPLRRDAGSPESIPGLG